MKTRIALLAALLALPGVLSVPTSVSAVSATPAGVVQRYILRLAPGADPRAEAARQQAQGHQVRFVYTQVFPGLALDLPAPVAAALAARRDVVGIEPDRAVRLLDTQSNPTWGLDRSDQRTLPLSATFTYPAAPGAGVTAYIVDTGINAAHAEFAGRVSSGYTAIGDGRGTQDCNGHGTHVAGTVGGTTYGVAKAATLVPVRVLDCAGSGAWSGVIAGLDWVAAQHQPGVPAVANLSLGGGASSSVDQAVANLVADGVSVAVAAGNSNLDACTTSPARVASALTVGATDRSDARASYSNYGGCLDLFAPGSSITSAWYTSSTATNIISGTSMAAPHVAGVAAVYLGLNPVASPAAVSSALLGSSTANVVTNPGVSSPNRLLYLDPTWTSGSLNLPAPVTNVAARLTSKTKRAATVAVSWTPAPSSPALSSQVVWVYRNNVRYRSVTVSPTATTLSVSSLPTGSSYRFSVIATNSVGSSPESALSNIITA